MSVASMLNGNVSKVFSFVENRAIYAVFRKCVMSTNKAKQLDDGRRTVIITGSNRGIGLAAVKELAATNKWNIVMACRSIEQAQAAKETIVNGAENVIVAHLDLADLSSIDQFVKDWGSKTIDCLALNAGVHSGNRKTPLRTKDGFEMTVGTNHIGHFHLTTQLVENVKKSEDGRIVFVASSGRCSRL